MSEQLPALPAWIDPEAYAGFVEMRKRQEKISRGKIPWTPRAEKLILGELYKLKERGHDPNKALDQSALKGWTDVYPPKDKEVPNLIRETYKHETLTPEERERSMAAKRKVFGALKVVGK